MPLTASGKLTVVASSDLGGLGSKNGSPTVYDWVLPSVAPVLLPWLMVLGLLALKPNRCVAAWLIWLPLGCVLALTAMPPTFLPGGTNFFLDVIAALGLGLAAIWLVAGYCRRQHRFITFLCVLLALVSFSALAAVLKQGMSLLTVQSLQIGVTLAVGVLASAGRLKPGWACLPKELSSTQALPVDAVVAGHRVAGDCRAVFYIRAVFLRRADFMERILHPHPLRGGRQFCVAPALPDFVIGQPIFRRTPQSAVACGARRAAAFAECRDRHSIANGPPTPGTVMKLSRRLILAGMLVASTALAQPEQWLSYHTGTEGRGYRSVKLTTNAPPGIKLPAMSAPPFFAHWTTPMDTAGGRWACFDRTRKSGAV